MLTSTIHTKVKTAAFAKQLRDRLAELKKAKPGVKAAYQRALAKWREDLREWVLAHAAERVADVQPYERSRHREPAFDSSSFFRGAPLPPEAPTVDRTIRDIQALLRQLGITGQATVTVSTEQVAELLGDHALGKAEGT